MPGPRRSRGGGATCGRVRTPDSATETPWTRTLPDERGRERFAAEAPPDHPGWPCVAADGIIAGRRSIRGREEREPSHAVFTAALDRRVDTPRRPREREVVVSVRDMDDARDRELLGRVHAGDPEGAAFRELFRRNAAIVKSVALRVTRSDQLAEEAVQEGFLQLWRAAERFDEARGAPPGGVLARGLRGGAGARAAVVADDGARPGGQPRSPRTGGAGPERRGCRRADG